MISIVIPTRDEPYIGKLIEEINQRLAAPHEIIVVDKSSTPPQLAGARLIRQQSNGLGAAIVEGFKAAQGDILVVMDGDGSHDPAYLDSMAKFIRDYDIVIGSKYVPGGSTEDYPGRILVSRAFNLFVSAFLGLRVKDCMSGFAMIRRGLVEELVLRPRGYKIVLEIMYKGVKWKGAKIKEIPVMFRKRQAGKSKVGFNLAGFREAVRIAVLALSLKFGRDTGGSGA